MSVLRNPFKLHKLCIEFYRSKSRDVTLQHIKSKSEPIPIDIVSMSQYDIVLITDTPERVNDYIWEYGYEVYKDEDRYKMREIYIE